MTLNVGAHSTFNILSVCSGVGGIELGFRLIYPHARTVCYVENEAYNVACLVQRMEDGFIEEAYIWTDVKTFEGKRWFGKVDCLTAGFPCQPFSLAGQRQGVDDPRWLWPHIAPIIRDCKPSYVFLENTPNIKKRGLVYILRDLSRLGYNVEWGMFSAGASGAPHERKRFYLLAYAQHDRDGRWQQFTEGMGEASAYLGSEGLAHGWAQGGYGTEYAEPSDSSNEAANINRTRQQKQKRSKRKKQGRSNNKFDEAWEYAWTIEPDVARMVYGIPYGMDRTRALGNAVLPTVVARAWCTLFERSLRNGTS